MKPNKITPKETKKDFNSKDNSNIKCKPIYSKKLDSNLVSSSNSKITCITQDSKNKKISSSKPISILPAKKKFKMRLNLVKYMFSYLIEKDILEVKKLSSVLFKAAHEFLNTKLEIDLSQKSPDDSFKNINSVLKMNLLKIESLNFSRNKFKPNQFEMLWKKRLPFLKEILFENCGLDDLYLKKLSIVNLSNLQVLNLKGNNFSNKGANYLYSMKLPKLTSLTFEICDLDLGKFTIMNLTQLETLILKGKTLDQDGIDVFSKYLYENLKTLRLDLKTIDDKFWTSLSQYGNTNLPKLENLNINSDKDINEEAFDDFYKIYILPNSKKLNLCIKWEK